MTFLGAFVCLCAGLVFLALACFGIQHERDAWANRRAAAHWRRFCRACGGEDSALNVVNAAEATADAATDVLMARGMRPARKVIPFPRIVSGKHETRFDSPPENAA